MDECIFECGDEAERKVVGRLIQQQDLWRVSQHYREGKATLLADAEFLHTSVVVSTSDQPEGAQRHSCRTFRTDQICVSVEHGATRTAIVGIR